MNHSPTDLPAQVKLLEVLQSRLDDYCRAIDEAEPYGGKADSWLEEGAAHLRQGRCLLTDAPRPRPAVAVLAAHLLGGLLEEALPQRAEDLARIRAYVEEDAAGHLDKVLGDRGHELMAAFQFAGLAEDLAVFHAIWLARPFRAWFAWRAVGQAGLNSWTGGSCPVCGHWPALSMIDTKAEGRRHLWCLHCGTAWRHPRLQCAFCGCSDQSRLRHIHLEGEENWRLQGCRDCKRYVKEFRSEEELGSLPWDALLLGSTELDLAAVQHDLMRESPLVSQRPHRPSPLAAAQIEDHHMSPNPERGR